MKRIYIFALLLTIAMLGASAQLKDFFNRYDDTDGVTSVYISKSLLRMMPDIDNDLIEIKGVAGKLDNLYILTTKKKSMIEKLKSDATAAMRNKGYEELLRVNENKEKTLIYTKNGANGVNEYLILNHKSDEFNAILIVGRITPADIRKIIDD